MFSNKSFRCIRGQSALEYLLLLGVVVFIVLVGFNTYLPRTQNQAGTFFNDATRHIYGESSKNKARTSYTSAEYP